MQVLLSFKRLLRTNDYFNRLNWFALQSSLNMLTRSSGLDLTLQKAAVNVIPGVQGYMGFLEMLVDMR